MKLLLLHGFSQNGGALRAHFAPLEAQLPNTLSYEAPDAPHACSPESVARLSTMLGERQPAPPHLCWWNATDDGKVYRGWEQSLEKLSGLVSEQSSFGVLGFSQGAIAASLLAALAMRGQFPRPAFVAMVAGRIPRAETLKALFDLPIAIPSLHVWGERDVMARAEAPKLSEAFAHDGRVLVHWNGPHVLPTFGPAAGAVVDFLCKHTRV